MYFVIEYIKSGDNMKKNLFIIGFILILMIIIIFTALNGNNKESKVNKLNNNPNVIKNQILDNLSITNVSITIDSNNESTFSADILKTDENENNIESIEIIFKDKNGNILTSLIGYIGTNMKKDDVIKISSHTSIDLSKATSIEYKKK